MAVDDGEPLSKMSGLLWEKNPLAQQEPSTH